MKPRYEQPPRWMMPTLMGVIALWGIGLAVGTYVGVWNLDIVEDRPHGRKYDPPGLAETAKLKELAKEGRFDIRRFAIVATVVAAFFTLWLSALALRSRRMARQEVVEDFDGPRVQSE